MSEDRLNALAILSIEKSLVRDSIVLLTSPRFFLNFGTKVYHYRQFLLFNVHGMTTFNYKCSLTKNYLPGLIFSLNSRRESSSF